MNEVYLLVDLGETEYTFDFLHTNPKLIPHVKFIIWSQNNSASICLCKTQRIIVKIDSD